MVCFVVLVGVKVGEFEIAPVMQTRSLRAFSCRQTLPIRWLKRIGNLGSRACDQSVSVKEVVARIFVDVSLS